MSVLFTPLRIGATEVGNRFVRSATGESASVDGRVSPAVIGYYERLARGGIGLIITGHAYVRREGRGHAAMTGMDRDDLLPLCREWVAVVHGHTAESETTSGTPTRLVMQINHCGFEPAERINAMRSQEIESVVAAFAQAARRVREAGFDGVQVHCAHGFLLSQFLDPQVNEREDRWGGTGIAQEVLRAVRREVGADYPVLVKFNCDALQAGGMDPEESAAVASALEQAGADALEVSGADAARTGIRRREQEAYFAAYARRIRAAIRVPVILVGGLRSMQRMEEVVESGTADMVSLCRPFIREPELVRRFRAEREAGAADPRAACVSCSTCWSSPETANRCGVLEKKPAPEAA